VESSGHSGSGLRYNAVTHEGNAQHSDEEAAVVAREVRMLLADGIVIDHDGQARPMTPAEILVVAPYNMQVRTLRAVLPQGVAAGTVDRFQGREAAVVLFSMASSTGDDVPRGLEFLFSRNRFNVAISRAKAMAVVVSSPRLLEARCRSLEQMRLVNALCAFAERAEAQHVQ
jgi:superfamily I DNA and/or RNA helicase